ncbi:hypothetical protein [Virgisporangium aurantiacum]|uniref:hypothetical protein n=1 Tax=Virgisporangium aurantiacum TaxID=175570 RepID=UPI001950DA96|nr:hypothetical protein [Virgisporangium aurantiacum]
MDDWDTAAQAAEQRGDLHKAIELVGSVAECYSRDPYLHNAHLWHLDLLARAGRLDELASLGESDVHARRRLDRALRDMDRDT